MEPDLFVDKGEEFDEVHSHAQEDDADKNVPSLFSVIVDSEEVSEMQQCVKVEGDHDLIEE